jgi:uncharacterized protein (TIGR02145 family)
MKQIRSFLILIFCLSSLLSCNKNPEKKIIPPDNSEVNLQKVDSSVQINNNIETIQIGSQIWTSHNLNVTTFSNGDEILEAKTDEEWKRASKLHIPAYCDYLNNPENGKLYGKLYNWYAVMDERSLAPKGFYVPNNFEYWVMLNHFGLFQHSNTKDNQTSNNKIKSFPGFNIQLSGFRYESGSFSGNYLESRWWSSQWSSDNTWNPKLNETKANPCPSSLSIDQYFISGPGAGILNAGCGFSIRCIKGSINRTLKIPVIANEHVEIGEDGKPLNGQYFWRESSGKVSREFINGIENGKRLTYDRSDYLISEENYKEGVLNGLSTYYSYYGKHIIEEGNYVDGVKDGEWIKYKWESHKNNWDWIFDKSIESIENYENGKRISSNSVNQVGDYSIIQNKK